MSTRPEAERFWEKVAGRPEPNGCWLWVGTVLRGGYGQFRDARQRKVVAHRMAWELTNGPIPQGMLVLHQCEGRYPPGNVTCRRCVNPAHLALGTSSENARARYRTGRGERLGERAPYHKLTWREVEAIRAEYRPYDREHGAAAIAKRMGLTEKAIRMLLWGKTWKV